MNTYFDVLTFTYILFLFYSSEEGVVGDDDDDPNGGNQNSPLFYDLVIKNRPTKNDRVYCKPL